MRWHLSHRADPGTNIWSGGREVEGNGRSVGNRAGKRVPRRFESCPLRLNAAPWRCR